MKIIENKGEKKTTKIKEKWNKKEISEKINKTKKKQKWINI